MRKVFSFILVIRQVLYKKSILIFSGLLIGSLFLGAGCSGTEQEQESSDTDFSVQMEKKSLSEIRKETETLKNEYKNLDLSETMITIPDVDEISSVVFPVSTDSLEKQIEKFENNIRIYEGLDETQDLTPYMNMMYWDQNENDRLVVPYTEARNNKELMRQIQYLSYNDGTCSELLVFSDYMLEMGDYRSIPSVENETASYAENPYGYRGIDLGTLVETFDYPEDDVSDVVYHLTDGDFCLQDAVDFVEKHVKEDYYFVGSEYLDYHVSEIEVRQLTDTVYYYQFQVYPSFGGVSFNKDRATPEDTGETMDTEPFGTTHRVAMFYHDRMGFIWSSCHSYESVEIKENNSEFISLEDACALLSEYITSSNPFSIESIELIYQTEFQYENEERRSWGYVQSIYCHPAYHFSVSNPGLSGYEKIYFDVDAVNGKITTMIY